MDGVVFFGCVGARELKDNLAATRVLGDEASDIVNIAVQNNPAALCRIVLRNCASRQRENRHSSEVAPRTFGVIEDLGHSTG